MSIILEKPFNKFKLSHNLTSWNEHWCRIGQLRAVVPRAPLEGPWLDTLRNTGEASDYSKDEIPPAMRDGEYSSHHQSFYLSGIGKALLCLGAVVESIKDIHIDPHWLQFTVDLAIPVSVLYGTWLDCEESRFKEKLPATN